ncbi:Gfo/Idh/MocA family oxidoreductase [Pontiellaceae bacterium B12227]|nr:Gfo/Idh/MocA family oxidoreductase [Pontiellaceae bacterium B12227]
MTTIRVGVVGLNFGRKIINGPLLQGAAKSFFKLAAVCDRDREICNAAALEYGVKAYYSLDDLLADDEIPVIILMTGPNGRADLLRKIIRAGKDCMTTKPFEIDPDEAAAVLAEARELGCFIYLNSPCAADSEDFKLINYWRDKYDLGMPVGGHHECWYKAVEEADGSWYDDPDECPAAPVFRLGIYGVNDMLRIFGEPEEIQVMQTRLFTGRPTPDYARMCIKFKSGAMADTLNGWVASPERQSTSLILYFERGTIYRNPTMMPCDPVRANRLDDTYLCLCIGDESDGMPVETARLPNNELSQAYQWDIFHHAVTTRKRPQDETPDEVVVNSLRILDAMKEAAKTGNMVKIGAKKNAGNRAGVSMSLKKCIVSFLLFMAAVVGAEVWDLPSLSTNYPLYGQLYSDVQVGNGTATGAINNFKEGAETLSAVYAYLHPQSSYQYDADVLARLKVLLNARFDVWTAASGNGLTDIAGSFQCAYAYMLLNHHRPFDLTALEITDWEAAMAKFCDYHLSAGTLLYDDHILADLWLNGDIRIAKAIYFSGVATGNSVYQTKAQQAIDLVMTQAVTGDGATHYVGFNNEVSTYRNVSINSMLWWWIITGSPDMKAALDQTIPYVPLSVEPGGFQEQSTGIAYKHMYNGLRGRQAALATAYLYGDRYNYYFGQGVEHSFNSDYAVLLAVLHRGPMTALPPPSDFVLYDRAIMGPRGRWADWAFVATGRNVQSPGPDHSDQGYDGKMIGKNTFVGAMALGSYANKTPLKGALDGVCPEFKNKTGPTSDWSRSPDGVYRFLSQDENTSTITRDTFGTLATDYRLSTRVSSPATPDWGAGTDWLGEQVWLLTEDRVVGLVQIHNEAGADVYGLDTRMVLTGGRTNIIGQYYDLVEVASNEYDFGELSLRIGENNFGGTQTVQRVGMQNGAGDEYGAILRLHDSADPADDTLIHYPSGTRRWVVIECIREGRSFAGSVNNVMEGNNNVAVLEVRETDRRFRLVQNLTSSARTYTGNFWGIGPGATATLHKSWTNTVDVVTPVPGNAIAIIIDLPPHGHVAVVSSTDSANHAANQSHYEDIFPQTADPAMSHYLDWIYSYPATGSHVDPEDDPDGDGVSNLGEYGFGGDPGDSAIWAVQIPELAMEGTNANYSYPRRKDTETHGLGYVVETTEDLVSNMWSTNGSLEVSGSINDEFDSVTNRFSILGKTNEFFRVRIDSVL